MKNRDSNFVRAITTEDYPYGPEGQAMKQARKWLKQNGRNGFDDFEYPSYADMPTQLSDQLDSGEVDFIQHCWWQYPR